jgi:hypothetical protein
MSSGPVTAGPERAEQMEERIPEAKIVTIEGQKALYKPAPSILPPSMATLLRVLRRPQTLTQLRFAGYRADCGEGNHRLARWISGYYGTREVLVSRCLDCEVAEVRDISFDTLPDLPTGRLALRRRSDLLGWYTGARAARRVYL